MFERETLACITCLFYLHTIYLTECDWTIPAFLWQSRASVLFNYSFWHCLFFFTHFSLHFRRTLKVSVLNGSSNETKKYTYTNVCKYIETYVYLKLILRTRTTRKTHPYKYAKEIKAYFMSRVFEHIHTVAFTSMSKRTVEWDLSNNNKIQWNMKYYSVKHDSPNRKANDVARKKHTENEMSKYRDVHPWNL